ncbi:MAG: D-glycero-beta-D-manno-heptose 1-phosphate adenylyltransferase [Candidatus Asgardarchaeum californiense]|nr:MAG: D-glycero-beta-D-manno-heptose 1-phosphate adenylyltransferase [Candidatus Asgardarchaeum californiense]
MDKPTVVFTNGCFDILHVGHIQLLRKARELGDMLVVGLNSDESIKLIKGKDRPIVSEAERYIMLKNLETVDSVMLFDEPDPLRLIKMINPDVLVKGGDWGEDEIIGADHVMENGGSVVTVPLIDGASSTNIINKIEHRYKRFLFNLLAIMHRDGGHYVDEHGVDKAVKDAMKVYYDLRARRGD